MEAEEREEDSRDSAVPPHEALVLSPADYATRKLRLTEILPFWGFQPNLGLFCQGAKPSLYFG